MPDHPLLPLLLLVIIAAITASGCIADQSSLNAEPITVEGTLLSPYIDTNNAFSLSKPADWTVEIGDAIVVKDAADGGTTNVKIQPIFLSGDYRSVNAEDIANYLVGSAIQYYQQFDLESVRETSDLSMLELVATYNNNGIDKKAVYTVFVQSPYALLTSYETDMRSFEKKENTLRAITASYTPITPEDLKNATSVAQATSSIGILRDTTQGGKVRMRLPDGWVVQVFPGCAGLIATDTKNSARGVILLNGLHSDYQTGLPSGTTPEEYVKTYMPRDFPTVSNVQILEYVDTAVSTSNLKTMKISFDSLGMPAIGAFTVGTRSIGGYYSIIDFFWGVYAPADQADLDAPILGEIFNSIDYSQSSLEQCRAVQRASWGIGSGSSGGSGSSAGTSREDQLKDWYDKQNHEDIFMEKYTDYIFNQDRVYNPETEEVYHVDENFYQYYDTHREEYKQQNMVLLTDPQYRSHVPLDGNLHIEPA